MRHELKLPSRFKMANRLWSFVPSGGSLPLDVWQSRHKFLLGLTWLHAGIIALVGPVLGYSWELSLEAVLHDGTVIHTVAEGLIVALFGILAGWGGAGRTLRATVVGFGLMSASAILVHLSGGYIELHFHFFVMLVFLALYQDWTPFILAIGYVAIHHGVVGVLWPEEVYNHTAALNAPWTWALIHAFFVLWASVGSVIAWRFNEKATAQTKLILDSAGEGIYGLDLEGKTTFVNSEAARMLGYEVEELIGRSMHEVLHHSRPDGTPYPRAECPIYAAFKDGTVHRVTEEVFWRKDGTSFPVDYVSTPIFERGELTGAVVTFRDVTRRQQRERALRESEERFRQIAESINEVFWVTDPLKNEWLYISPAYKEIWGRNPDHMGPLAHSWLGAIHPEDLGRVLAAVVNQQVAGRYDEEYRIVRPDGSTRWIRDRAFPLRDRSGGVHRITGIAEDITERRLAQEKLKVRYKELETLHELGQIILRSPDIKTVIERILDQALSVVSLDLGVIRLLDPVVGVLNPVASRGYRSPKKLRIHQVRGATTGNIISRVMEFKGPLVVENVPAWEGLRTLKEEGVESAIIVPVRTEEEIIGVIQLGSRTPRKFQPDEVRLLEGIGNHMGVAVQKARLFQETGRNLERIRALHEIDLAITSSLDLPSILDVLLEKTDRLVPFIAATTVRLFNRQTGELEPIACRNLNEKEWKARSQDPASERFAGLLPEGNRPLIVLNSQKDPRFLGSEFLRKNGLVSFVRVPLIAKGETLGVITFFTKEEHAFTNEEIEFLKTLAGQTAIAIHNSQLYEEARRRAREQEALNAIANATTQSLDLDDLLQISLDKVLEVTGRERVNIRLKDPVTGEVELRAYRGFSPEEIEALRLRKPHNMSDQVFAFGQALVIQDSKEVSPGTLLEQSRSVAWVPIKARAKVVGVLGVSDNRSVPFSSREVEFLIAIGNVLGPALENARLFKATERNLEQIRALQEIDKAITSTLDLENVLKVLLDKINILLPYSAATVRLFNKASKFLEPVACRNLDESEWKVDRWRVGRGIPNVVFETKTCVIIPNVQTDPRIRDLQFFQKHGLVSYAGLPLMVQGEVLGVLSLYTKEVHDFRSYEMEFLTALAGQAAVAIHNSQLYEAARTREAQLREKTAELEAANKVKDEFLSVMSHELRTPLNVVMGYAAMLKDGMLGQVNLEQEKALDKVIRRAADQLTMITSIIQATRIETGEVQLESREFSLGDFLEDLRSGYEMSLGKEVALNWHHPSHPPVIESDREKLKLILQNLINNAVKFTQKGSVTVSVKVRQSHGSGRLHKGSQASWVVFEVSDTGIGIPKDALPFIFDKFRQVDSSETRLYGGVGLGLYIAKRYTELLGGNIKAESELGKGSTFTVAIPCPSRGLAIPAPQALNHEQRIH